MLYIYDAFEFIVCCKANSDVNLNAWWSYCIIFWDISLMDRYLSVKQQVKPWTCGGVLVGFTPCWAFLQSGLGACYFCIQLFQMNVCSDAYSVKVKFSPKACVSRHNLELGNTLGYMLEGRPSFCGMLPHLFWLGSQRLDDFWKQEGVTAKLYFN